MSYLSVKETNMKCQFDFVATNPSSILLPFLNSLLVSYLSVNKTNIKWEYDFVATNPSSILLPFLNSLSVLSIGEED